MRGELTLNIFSASDSVSVFNVRSKFFDADSSWNFVNIANAVQSSGTVISMSRWLRPRQFHRTSD